MIRRLTGVRIEDFSDSQLKYGLTIGTATMLRITQMLIRQLEPSIIKLLARHWQRSRADLVVSMIPNFNHAILQGLRQADAMQRRSETPMVTILTDMADCPPHFWIERQAQYLVCGTEAAAAQAFAMGHAPERVIRTSGNDRPSGVLSADRDEPRSRANPVGAQTRIADGHRDVRQLWIEPDGSYREKDRNRQA